MLGYIHLRGGITWHLNKYEAILPLTSSSILASIASLDTDKETKTFTVSCQLIGNNVHDILFSLLTVYYNEQILTSLPSNSISIVQDIMTTQT